MAITQCVTTTFKQELFGGTHVFGTDTFRLALYQSSASLDASTTAYTATGEASGTNYTAGGANLTTIAATTSGTTAFVDFNDLAFPNVSITARGAMIYNSSKANRSVVILDFGSDKSPAAQTLTVVFPSATAANAIIRIQ